MKEIKDNMKNIDFLEENDLRNTQIRKIFTDSWTEDGITVKVIGDGTRTEKISSEDLKKAAETQQKRR